MKNDKPAGIDGLTMLIGIFGIVYFLAAQLGVEEALISWITS